MFVNNKKYTEGFHSHNPEIVGNQVVIYPENMLPEINVTSDFGDCEVVTADMYDLLNQQRIANLGPDVIRDFITRNYPATSPISEEISKMSDLMFRYKLVIHTFISRQIYTFLFHVHVETGWNHPQSVPYHD